MEVLVGTHAVEEALRAGRRKIHQLLVRRDTSRAAAIVERAQELGVPVATLEPGHFDAKFPEGGSGRQQGVLLEVEPLPPVSLESLVVSASGSENCLIALDGVEDPQNLGSIARIADAAGALGIVTGNRRAAPVSPAASRASAGALEHLPVARAPNLVRALESLKSHDYWVVGADSREGEDLFRSSDRTWEGNVVIVLGSEGRGLRPGVSAKLDFRVQIPMAGRVESLNVASAASLLIFEWSRRRTVRGAGADRG